LKDFKKKYQERTEYINEGLAYYLSQRDSHPAVLEAMKYSLLAGGKRLRPVLFLSACELSSDEFNYKSNGLDGFNAVLPMACALEMIHTYSLIHDDLPAMDNDDYRRGKPTNHKVFGEAMAILAGDGLLNLAYEIMLEHLPSDQKKLTGYLKAMSVIAKSAGISGMIGGQSADIQSQNNNHDKSVLEYIHSNKTEALITASLKAGVLVSNEDKRILEAVSSFGRALGLAFQITDDILDLMGDMAQLGKSPGSDVKQGKLTYPAIYGLEKSRKMASMYIKEAVSILQPFGKKAEFLISLAESILDRNR
jgi:geranylgeranyl diphosphate synthase type II